MNTSALLECIAKNGRSSQLLDLFVSVIPKLPNDLKEHVTHEMERLAYSFTPDQAKEIVRKMTPYGEHWAADKVKAYIASKGVDQDDCIHYYLVMNMMYNDYYQTAQAFGQKDNADFYFSLAKNFIDDADGVDFKVEKYFEM